MSILAQIEPALLRRLAASMAGRLSEYADLFLERSCHASVARDGGAERPPVAGAASGAAARLVSSDRVWHASVGRLDPDAVAALPACLKTEGMPIPPRRGAGRPGEGAREAGPEEAGEATEIIREADALGSYLKEVEEAAAPQAGPGGRFTARGEIRRGTIAVATSEGDLAEDRRDWVAFSARLDGEGRGGTAIAASEGGGALDLARLAALHPPRVVGERLARGLREQREAAPPPSGEMTVVLAPGPGGILFHEACGHALEGDRALKGRSALVDHLGEDLGPSELTLVDDPTLPGLPGSRRVDDEGWPAARNVLIEAGRVVGLLLDRATALLAGTAPTGSARRESYRDLPLPRMSNTFVVEGTRSPEEILASVPRGVYIAELGAGEVDTVTADFSFRVRRGYLVAGGRIVAPIAPAVVSGNGLAALRGIAMIGNDLRFDPGAGECGKDGQRARAAVGQPTIKVTGLTIRPAGAR